MGDRQYRLLRASIRLAGPRVMRNRARDSYTDDGYRGTERGAIGARLLLQAVRCPGFLASMSASSIRASHIGACPVRDANFQTIGVAKDACICPLRSRLIPDEVGCRASGKCLGLRTLAS